MGSHATGTNGAAYGAGVDEAIRRATAEAPADRFVSVSTFSQAFGAALGGEPVAETEEGADGNPYRGLEAFQEADAAVFFGRQSLVDQLLGRLESTHGHRFLAVVGASGSGKSSVVRAGLVPALRAGALAGSGDWFIVQMVPGFTPLHDLEAALLRIAVNPSGRPCWNSFLATSGVCGMRPTGSCRTTALSCCWSWISSRSCSPSPTKINATSSSIFSSVRSPRPTAGSGCW